MKKLILPLFALITYASNAQLSIVPQVGVETFRTTIKSGDFSSFSPLGQQFTPSLAVRMAYTSRSGQGAFFGVATSSPAVDFKFTNPQNAQTSYTASASGLQLRLEAGYQFTSKPITIGKPVYKNNYAGKNGQKNSAAKQNGCSRSMCSRMKNSQSDYKKAAAGKMKQDNRLYMRIKPSLGLAIVPTGSRMETETKGGQTVYSYRAGLNTALIAGTAFEFGSRNQAKLLVSINYLKGLGNNTQTVTNNEGSKTTSTAFSSKTSGFNINVGIPFSFSKKTKIIQNRQSSTPSRYGHCRGYKVYQL